MKNMKNVVAGTTLFMAVGSAAGAGVEAGLDAYFKSQVISAKACLKAFPAEETITEELDVCLDHGIPGEAGLQDDQFKAGDRISILNGVVDSIEKSTPFNPLSLAIGAGALGCFALYMSREDLSA